ncbi:Uncharacterised protein [Candidatus Gugararchaeum adminiculabundum]|nr:Uncharacterised protein [Candidatus Gugararchaeum adminiculabundum]
MSKIAEIKKVKEWCKKIKAERNRVYAIERNPFQEEISWMRRFTKIEIDRPQSIADKYSLLYDSATDSLYEYINNSWRKVSEIEF